MKNKIKIKFDFSKLRGRIIEYYNNVENLAPSIGFSKSNFSLKLNNRRYFNSLEIIRICKVLNISHSEIPDYFYNVKDLSE